MEEDEDINAVVAEYDKAVKELRALESRHDNLRKVIMDHMAGRKVMETVGHVVTMEPRSRTDVDREKLKATVPENVYKDLMVTKSFTVLKVVSKT